MFGYIKNKHFITLFLFKYESYISLNSEFFESCRDNSGILENIYLYNELSLKSTIELFKTSQSILKSKLIVRVIIIIRVAIIYVGNSNSL